MTRLTEIFLRDRQQRRWVMIQQVESRGLRVGERIDDQIECEVDHELPNVIELTGAIKWFDVSKGYGFIVPDNGMSDILLNVSCLRRDGFQAVREGARVVVVVVQRPRGLQAFRILSMDESTAVPLRNGPSPRRPVVVPLRVCLERAPVAVSRSPQAFVV